MNRLSPAERWMLIAGGVLVAFFALDATFSVRNVQRLRTQSQAVVHTYAVAGAIERVMSDLKDAETGQRGYLITGNEEYLAPYRQASRRVDIDLAGLEALLLDPRQLVSVAELRDHARAKLDELDVTILARRESGFDAAREAVATNVGKREMDAMRGIGDTLMRRETDLLADREAAADAATYRASAQIIISDAIGAVAVIALILVLRRHYASLHAADRRKDEFLATLAHELRNPLAPMSNSLFILSQRDAAQHLRERALSTLQRQVRQMVKLIDDLLDVGRIRLGKLALSKRVVKLGDIVEQAVETVAPLVESSRHRLAIDVPPEPIYLEADPIRLAQIISNLVNNAAKFTPAGGAISLTVSVAPGSATLRVKDNGVGIDPKRLEDIFGLFAQLDQSVERQHSGLGIGLALVRRLAELHGGTVVAVSEGQGRGSEFILRLPTVAAPALPILAPSPQQEAPARMLKVMVVDDNTDGAESLAAIVRLVGHDARAVQDAQSALRAGEEWRPDLVIMDIGMPGMNGYDACTAMRGTPWGRNALIVALTGWGQEHDRRRAESAGFDRHLVKPIGEEALRTLLEDASPAAESAPAAA
jgi:signal transduction histidine kinase/CheY-like chemotaxis protein